MPGPRPKQQCPSLTCKHGGRCIYREHICDGVVDCLDAEDEMGCESYSNHPIIYPYPEEKIPLNLSGIRGKKINKYVLQ